MSWDATLTNADGQVLGEWNYTHNTSTMIYAALGDYCPHGDRCNGLTFRDCETSWWGVLDGLTGPDGAAFLHRIVTRLEADPARYEAMNPANGWGSYARLVEVLTAMRDAVPEWPTTWAACG